ncbi:MAG: hypothetical protein K2X86_13505 [Cytophagaceae bacterium]|nr:hypothetical protein [Cytophagaceae bacterium]
MDNYKINKNKPDLPDERINKHKDFSKILANHQKVMNYKDTTKPLYKNPGFMGLMMLLSVVLLVFVIVDREEGQKEKKKDKKEILSKGEKKRDSSGQILSDTTPVKGKIISKVNTNGSARPEVSFTSYKVDAAKGGVIYDEDTRIIIPPNAFTDQQGNIIKENIRIDFRTFKDPVDFFLSGIPMTWESAKGKQSLQSAGMFEIKGFYGDQPAKIKTPLAVELSTQAHNGYNHYYFNETSKKWELIGKEKASIRFIVQADEKEYPEMKPLQDIIWELVINDMQKDPTEFNYVFSKTWSSFNIGDADKKNGKYIKLNAKPVLTVRPVNMMNDLQYDDAVEVKIAEHIELKKQEKLREQAILKEAKFAEKWLASTEGQAYLKWLRSPEGQRQFLSSRVVNTFAVEKFGIYNCDTPIDFPKGRIVSPIFTDQNGKKVEVQAYNLVDYSLNTVYAFDPRQALTYNPKSTNAIWAALPDGKLAIFSTEKFKNVNPSLKTFAMEVIDVNGKTTEEVKAILGMKNHITVQKEEKEKSSLAVHARVIQMKKEVRKDNDILFQKDSLIINTEGELKKDLKNKVKTPQLY